MSNSVTGKRQSHVVAGEPSSSELQSLECAAASQRPLLWVNPEWRVASETLAALPLNAIDIETAEANFSRWAKLLVRLFPELAGSCGIIESELRAVVGFPGLQAAISGRSFIKADHALPVSGSIKARGGFYEVLLHAESLAVANEVIFSSEDSESLASPRAREFFSRHTVIVGSTGNLGLSIGTIAAALGFRTIVHMSADAKAWKKQRLRALGVEVIEHGGDFATAVAAGRDQSVSETHAYFVDDEDSQALFLGYSVAARRLQKQLTSVGVPVDARNPLFVYLPCGVGGSPGGITFGLKHIFGDHVHCFLAEPVASPSMLVRLAIGRTESKSVYDIGLDCETEADGLAVARASEFAANMVRSLVSGIFTVRDEVLFSDLAWALDVAGARLEPSAAAGFRGPHWVVNSDVGKGYLRRHRLLEYVNFATHVVWTTGGALVPEGEHEVLYERGRRARASSR